MTPEEAAQLKNGDLIFINNFPVKFTKTNNTVIIHFDDSCHEISHGLAHCQYFSKEEYVPVPKYSSSRPFRKGDVVELVERNGRCPYSLLKYAKLIVQISENSDGMVGLHKKGYEEPILIHYSNLVLVTPVEEMEPYQLNEIYDIDDGDLIGYEVVNGDTKEAIFYGGKYSSRTLKQAKAAAEAERTRLNAEHRKALKND